ncbi:MAG: trimeric intracellular cation channel family protein [Rikenellaceae bacterium]
MEFTDIVEYLGTIAFAVSGIRLAARKKFDLFGAFVVGFITATGGGTVRDMLLQREVFWLSSPSFLICTVLGLVIVILFRHWLVKLEYTFFIFDAVGLGLFTVTGIVVTLEMGHSMLLAIILGTVTGSIGGVMRDVLINEVPLIFREDIYATASVFGGLIFAILTFLSVGSITIQIVTILSIILIRVLVVKYKLRLPAFSGKREK